MVNQSILNAHQLLTSLAVILGVGAVARKLASKFRIPDVVIYLIAGIIIGPALLNLVNLPVDTTANQLVLTLGAAVLLFHGGLGVNCRTLGKVWLTLLLLSTLAVFIMIGVVGYMAHIAFDMELIYAFLLAAIIAPTDPATIIPIFNSIGINERLAQTVISEAAFNDATGTIVTLTILGALSSGEVSIVHSTNKFMVMGGGGIAIGAFWGLLAGYLLSNKSKNILAEHSQIIIAPVIIASYLSAEYFSASGFMAVFIAGVILGNLDEVGWTIKANHHAEVHSFINVSSRLLQIVMFILLGSHINLDVVCKYIIPSASVVFVIIFVARPLAVLFCTLPDRKAAWSPQEILFMFWTRETGVIPAALVGILDGSNIRYAEIISSVTFLAIIATVTIQATTTPWLAKKLELTTDSEKSVCR